MTPNSSTSEAGAGDGGAVLTEAPPPAADETVRPRVSFWEIARTFNDYTNPASGIGPVTDDPAHPFVNNEVAREMSIPPTYRVADLNNAAGRNLMPWVQDALKAQNVPFQLRAFDGKSFVITRR